MTLINSTLQLLFGIRFLIIKNVDFGMYGFVYNLKRLYEYSDIELHFTCKYKKIYTKWLPGRKEAIVRQVKWELANHQGEEE